MQIDIRRTAIRIRLRSLALAFIFSILVLAVLFTTFLDNPIYGIGKSHIIIALGLIYLGITLYHYLRDYHFVYYSDEGNKLILRYYSMRPLSQAKRSIEIPKGTLVKYELNKSMQGLREKIILFQKVKNGVYKYPPVSITALNKEEKEKMLQSIRTQLPR